MVKLVFAKLYYKGWEVGDGFSFHNQDIWYFKGKIAKERPVRKGS